MNILRLALIALILCFPRLAAAQDTSFPRAIAPEDVSGRLERIIQRGTLIVGVKADYPPWGMVRATEDAPEGRLVGIEPDLAQRLADRLGVELELRAVTSDNRLARVNQGVVDVVIATMGDTIERRGQADLILPNYYSSGVVLYARGDLTAETWEALRGKDVCLTRGAYYNRILEEEYGIVGRYYPGNREARLALGYGRCVGWAFDDTALVQQAIIDHDPAFRVMEETILVAPWSIAVAQGEKDAALGRFVADMVAEWHAYGVILELQRKWNVPETSYVRELNRTWSQVVDGQPVCARQQPTGAFPPDCVNDAPFEAPRREIDAPGWVDDFARVAGVDLTVLFDAYNRARLAKGLGLTLALSAVAIVGALAVGIILGLADAAFRALGVWGRILLWPLQIIVVLARMTPPILQLYIFFFGIGGMMAAAGYVTPTAFVTAAIVLSFYAGATNAVLIAHALEHERAARENAGVLSLLPGALLRAFDGLVAACINIVKAAGMASALAMTELISAVNLIVSEGGPTATLMNGLLVFYFLFVLALLWLFRRAKTLLPKGADQ